MHAYQTAFLKLALEHEVLKFGQFTLKSGRISPYFFNLGKISSGAAMSDISRAYAEALAASGLEYDMLFGPAYKGIPLVSAVSIALAERGRDLPYAYNRKEAKDHGEGGVLVGAAGTALREAVGILRKAGADPVAAVIALDRQEVGPNGQSAVAEMERDTGIRVVPLVTVKEVLQYLQSANADAATIAAMQDYQARYGVKS